MIPCIVVLLATPTNIPTQNSILLFLLLCHFHCLLVIDNFSGPNPHQLDARLSTFFLESDLSSRQTADLLPLGAHKEMYYTISVISLLMHLLVKCIMNQSPPPPPPLQKPPSPPLTSSPTPTACSFSTTTRYHTKEHHQDKQT